MKYLIIIYLFLFTSPALNAQDTSLYSQSEIIYGRKDGMALTMVKLSPKQRSNGKGIVSVVSGFWRSSSERIPFFTTASATFLKRGYSIFLVIHSSQPRYTLPDEVADIKRAVRFIRYHAAEYGIDPAHLGITGGSSGGHLALMVATADDRRDSTSKDPVDRVSARVQAAAIFYPPTDLLNFGQTGYNFGSTEAFLRMIRLSSAFDFKKWSDSLQLFVPMSAAEKLVVGKEMSPIYAVTPDDPPVIIIHGDKDLIVPIQQSTSIIERFKEAKVPNSFIIKKGGGHGWGDASVELAAFADWFDKYL